MIGYSTLVLLQSEKMEKKLSHIQMTLGLHNLVWPLPGESVYPSGDQSISLWHSTSAVLIPLRCSSCTLISQMSPTDGLTGRDSLRRLYNNLSQCVCYFCAFIYGHSLQIRDESKLQSARTHNRSALFVSSTENFNRNVKWPRLHNSNVQC